MLTLGAHRHRTLTLVATVASLTFLVIAMALPTSSRSTLDHSAPREKVLPDIAPGSPTEVRRLVAQSLQLAALPTVVTAQIPHAIGDNAGTVLRMPDSCVTATSCVYGDRRGVGAMVLFGDSHARMWIGAINPLAREEHLRLIVLGHNGCPLVALTTASSYSPTCVTFRQQALEVIAQVHARAVILTNRTTYGGFTSAQWQSALGRTFQEVRASGSPLLMIGDIQEFALPLPDCLARFSKKVAICFAHESAGIDAAEREVARENHVPYIDPRQWLCARHTCSPVIGSFIAYWNGQHVSYRYSQYLAVVMAQAIRARVHLH